MTRPNILFIVADHLSAWIGAMGRHRDVRTPAINALAARGTLFSRAYCSVPYCNASRMGVFTGCLPATTGIYQNHLYLNVPGRQPSSWKPRRARPRYERCVQSPAPRYTRTERFP